MKQFLVIGIGRFGLALAEELKELGYEVMAADYDENLVQRVLQDGKVTHSVQLDITDKKALESLGIDDFDAVIVAIGSKLQESILATVFCKELGAKKVIAKASSITHGQILEKVGADQVVFPERAMGKRIAHSLISEALDYVEVGDQCSILEIAVPKKFIGKTLEELALRPKYKINVLAIRRNNQVISDLTADFMIESGDSMLLIGQRETINKLG